MAEINVLGIIAITIVIIAISIILLDALGIKIRIAFPGKFGEAINNLLSGIFRKGPFNICEAYSGRQLSEQEFRTLLLAIYHGQCGNVTTSISLGFSLTQDDLKEIAEISDIAQKGELIFYREAIPVGAGAIIVEGNPGPYPFKRWDEITIKFEGKPQQDILMKVVVHGCDPYDGDCDLMCTYKSGICDPLCYRDRQVEDVLCDFDCVDVNTNGRIDAGDLDGVCDLDCYNNIINPGRAYDPDCVLIKNDVGLTDICDPDSVGVVDGLCDPKCAETNFMCDFDCDGVVDEGNPLGLRDDDCYTCDGTCNSFCAPVCIADDEDPDCPNGYDEGNLVECCGNSVCGIGEDCSTCTDDCPAVTDCSGLEGVCCPEAFDVDEYGCSLTTNVPEGSVCSCNVQCEGNLVCDSTSHCCPDGMIWTGTQCEIVEVWDIVYVALNYPDTDAAKQSFRDAVNFALQDFMAKSPFKDCPDPNNRVAVHYVDPANCRETCTTVCSECQNDALRCVSNSPYADIWDKIAGLSGSSFGGIIGCAAGIPTDTSVTYAARLDVVIHEVGHSLGLCHLNCGDATGACLSWCPNRDDCSPPRTPDEVSSYIMDYCDGFAQFGPTGYQYMKDNTLNRWLDGC